MTAGFLCAKVNREHELVHSPERLQRPLRRIGPKGEARFAPISWDEALGEIVERWQRIFAEDGPLALLGYAYSAHQGQLNRGLLLGLFHALGVTRLQAGTVCDTCAEAGWDAACGSIGGSDPESVVDSDLVISWGADLLTTNLHIWPLVEQARAKGAPLVVIEPRRSGTAARADWHLRVNVGTDAAIALGRHARARARRPLRPRVSRARDLGLPTSWSARCCPASPPRGWRRSPASPSPTSSGSPTCTAGRGRPSSGWARGCRAAPRAGRPSARWRSCPAYRRRLCQAGRRRAAHDGDGLRLRLERDPQAVGPRDYQAGQSFATRRGAPHREGPAHPRALRRREQSRRDLPRRGRRCAAGSRARTSSPWCTIPSCPIPRATPTSCCPRRRTTRARTSCAPTGPTGCSSSPRWCRRRARRGPIAGSPRSWRGASA